MANIDLTGYAEVGPGLALDLAVESLPSQPLRMEIGSSGHDITLSFWGLPFRTYDIKISNYTRRFFQTKRVSRLASQFKLNTQ